MRQAVAIAETTDFLNDRGDEYAVPGRELLASVPAARTGRAKRGHLDACRP